MAKKPHLFIHLSCQRFIFARTTYSLVLMAQQAKDFTFTFYIEMGCEIASSRNRAVHEARKVNATHLLFVDYDMFFDPETISKLLEQDKDIIGAAYNMRKDPPKSTAVPIETPAPEDKPFKCHILGTGLMLINMKVFDTFESPWFIFAWQKDGTMLYGEDSFFCQKAIAAGTDVWADPTLGVKHIGEQLF